MTDTANAPERIWAWPHGETDWTDIISAFFKNPTWISKKRGVAEYVLATHCDELVEVAGAEGALEAQAKIARLTEALKKYEDTLCEGFCGDCPRGYVDKSMLRDCGGCLARAALQENANG